MLSVNVLGAWKGRSSLASGEGRRTVIQSVNKPASASECPVLCWLLETQMRMRSGPAFRELRRAWHGANPCMAPRITYLSPYSADEVTVAGDLRELAQVVQQVFFCHKDRMAMRGEGGLHLSSPLGVTCHLVTGCPVERLGSEVHSAPAEFCGGSSEATGTGSRQPLHFHAVPRQGGPLAEQALHTLGGRRRAAVSLPSHRRPWDGADFIRPQLGPPWALWEVPGWAQSSGRADTAEEIISVCSLQTRGEM